MSKLDEGLDRLSIITLMLLAAAVPLFARQPTNILAFLLVFLISLRMTLAWKSWIKQLSALDVFVILLLVSAIVSTLLGRVSWQETWHGVNEALIGCATYWTIRKTQLRRAYQYIADIILLATALSVCVVLFRHWMYETVVDLPGVRGTIRSSLYVAMCLILSLAYALICAGWRRILGWLASCIFFIYLPMLASRAVITLASILVVIMGLLFHRGRTAKLIMISFFIVLAGFFMLPNSSKQRFYAKADELTALLSKRIVSANDQVRIETWRVALAWIKTGNHVLFGIGPRQYHTIDVTELKLDPPLTQPESFRMSHAHNIFLTRYIEYGLVGLIVLLGLFFLWLKSLIKKMSVLRGNPYWWGGMSALVLPVTAGMVGSAWGYEYAWLAMLFLAIYIRSLVQG